LIESCVSFSCWEGDGEETLYFINNYGYNTHHDGKGEKKLKTFFRMMYIFMLMMMMMMM